LQQLALLITCAALLTGCADNPPAPTDTPGYTLETLVPGSPLHGAKGIRFGPDGDLYVCSVVAQSVFRVDVTTGAVSTAVGPPHGESDDVAFAPDGTMAWTANASAEIRAQQPGGEPYVLARRLTLINPIGYTPDGRLFAAQIGVDRFLEIDPAGVQAPRLIARQLGHLNSFDVVDDQTLYGPLAGLGQVAKIELASGEVTVISEGLGTLSAVKRNSKGQLYALGWTTGQLFRVHEETGEAEVLTVMEPPLDSIAIDADDMLYVSQPGNSAIIRVDPATGEQTLVVGGRIGLPGGLSLTRIDGKETLIVADDFAVRHVDPQTGEVWATVDVTDFMIPSNASDVVANERVIVMSDVAKSRVTMLDRRTGYRLHQWQRLDTPYGLVLANSGEPIVAAFGSGQLIQLRAADRRAREVIAEGLQGPVGLARAGPNSLYVTEALAGAVSRIDINTGEKTVLARGLQQPEGLAVLANGQLVVAEVGAQQVTAIDPATGATTLLADNLPIGIAVTGTPAPVYVPTGVAADAAGVLYVSSDRDRKLLRLVPQ
jgi:sugar lactone lactonase YvrE